MYKIEYASTRVNRDIKKIPENERQNLIDSIQNEIIKPFSNNIKLLEESKKQKIKRFRLRIGKYRIFFLKDKKKKIIQIYKILLRKDAYK